MPPLSLRMPSIPGIKSAKFLKSPKKLARPFERGFYSN